MQSKYVSCTSEASWSLKQSAADALKTPSKRGTQKAAEATGDLIDNKIADKITKIFKNFAAEYFRVSYKRSRKFWGLDFWNTKRMIYTSTNKNENYLWSETNIKI